MFYELNNFVYKGSKVMNNLITFYWLDNQMVTCKWKNKAPPGFRSDEIYLIEIEGLLL